MSQQWGVRPSELYGIEPDTAAFFFDRAVYVFGVTVDADLEEASDGAKDSATATMQRRRRLNMWLAQEGETPQGVYRDPFAGR